MEGISKERLREIISLNDKFPTYSTDEINIIKSLERACEELDPWLPIDSAPVGKKGFLAINKDRGNIEWLSDIGEDKFYNNNSNNFTDKSHWTHYKELPPATKD